jgi:hypothetical protein
MWARSFRNVHLLEWTAGGDRYSHLNNMADGFVEERGPSRRAARRGSLFGMAWIVRDVWPVASQNLMDRLIAGA